MSLFEKLIKREPSNPKLRKALATAYRHRNEPEKELENLLALIGLQPNDVAAAKRAAEVAVEHNLVDKLLQNQSPKMTILAAHEVLRQQAVGEQAVKILKYALQMDSDNPDFKSYLDSIAPAGPPPPPPTRSSRLPFSRPSILFVRRDRCRPV